MSNDDHNARFDADRRVTLLAPRDVLGPQR